MNDEAKQLLGIGWKFTPRLFIMSNRKGVKEEFTVKLITKDGVTFEDQSGKLVVRPLAEVESLISQDK